MNNKQWLLTEKERKLVADYREACFSTDLIAIIDRLTTPPAPQAGEIEREIKVHTGVYDTNPETAFEFPHGPVIEVNGSSIYFDLYQEKLAEEVLAALRSAQAPARTYADGIEDAAKLIETCGEPIRERLAARVRALANKAPDP